VVPVVGHIFEKLVISQVPNETEKLLLIKIKGQSKRTQSRLIRLIGVVFSNRAMLSVSDKYDSVNEHTQELSELMKLYTQGVWQYARKFFRQLAH